MNVYISVDMEGVAGVVTRDHVASDHKEYERFRRLMTAETNAAIEGALAGGATHILVNDSHGGMANILIEELHPAAELISGDRKPLGQMQGIGPEVKAVLFVGYHSRQRTGAGVRAHTVSGNVISEVSLNGIVVGETGLNAAMAGAHGVPVVLVAGDKAVTEEARALLGEIETVAVKEGITWASARCLHPQVAQRMIREAAERAVKAKGKPFVVPPPITLRAVFHQPGQADMASWIPGSQRLDGVTVEYMGPDMAIVYRTLLAMIQLGGQTGPHRPMGVQ